MDLVESYKEELRLIDKPWKGFWIALLVLALILLPWFTGEDLVYIATLVFIYSIGVQGQNILIGYTGQISLGQAGFLAIGAFTFGHLSKAGAPLLLGLLGAGLVAAFFGVLVGFPSLRLKGPYLAIVTLGFGIAVYQVFTAYEFLSGGRMGMIVPKLEPFLGLSREVSAYYFTLLVGLFFTILSYNLISSYIGRAFIAVRDNDIAAEVMGVNLTQYKLLSFAISSFYTGVHGALFGMFLGFLCYLWGYCYCCDDF
jgi:branched-chain amino acid transport system permease protein